MSGGTLSFHALETCKRPRVMDLKTNLQARRSWKPFGKQTYVVLGKRRFKTAR